MKTFVARTLMIATLLGTGVLVSPIAAAGQVPAVAPTLIPVSGQFTAPGGGPRTGPALLVVSLYEGKDDTAPRWIEYHPVTLDALGRYEVQFGAKSAEGLPADLFTGAAATRWIGVAIEGEAEQPRVMLVSVPYAAKAASADTLAGKTLNEFVMASTFKEDVRAAIRDDRTVASAGSEIGDAAAVSSNYLQKGTGVGTATTDSIVFESAAGTLGIGTTSPGGMIDGVMPQLAGADGWKSHLVRGAPSNYPSFSAGLAVDATGAQSGIGLTWGGRTKLFVQGSDGFLGIGTTSPTAMIDGVAAPLLASAGWKAHVIKGSPSGYPGLTVGLAIDASGAQSGIALTWGGNTRFFVQGNDGSVGIGTVSPSSKLHVVGNVTVDGNIGAKYQDVAEWVDSVEPLEPGSLVVIDQKSSNRVAPSTKSYDPRVAGAVSLKPGVVLGEPGEGKVLVAQSGRVKVKADARYGAIHPGDLLVTSPTKGHAMRSQPLGRSGNALHRPGTLVGKALEPLLRGQGEILVLLTLQ